MALYADLSFPPNFDSTPSGTATITATTIGIAAIQLLAANTNRKGFTIKNTSNRTIFLGVNNTVSATANFFAVIPSQGLYEWTLDTAYTGAIFAISNLASATAQVLELTP